MHRRMLRVSGHVNLKDSLPLACAENGWRLLTATAALCPILARAQWNCKRKPHDWPHEAFVCAHPPPSTPSLCPEAPFSLNRLEPWCVGARWGCSCRQPVVGCWPRPLARLERLVKMQVAKATTPTPGRHPCPRLAWRPTRIKSSNMYLMLLLFVRRRA